MRKNLLQPEIKDELVLRVLKLNAQTPKQWGKMNVNQMLYHSASAVHIAYGEIVPVPRGNWFVKQLMRYFILRSDFPTPKEKADTFPEINMVAKGINPPGFETEKKKVMELVKSFPSKELYPVSSLLGRMTKENWGRLLYTHFDHHFKQFGV